MSRADLFKLYEFNIKKSSRKQTFGLWKFSILCFLVVLMVSTLALPAQARQSEDDAITQIDDYIQNLAEEHLFSGSVLIAQDGEILLSQGYGMANMEWNIPNTPQTKFRIASMTKQFTAMAILLLQERGVLTIQDSICQYLEECPDAWQEITIHHLLTHTSGIPDFTSFSDYRQTMAQPSLPKKTLQRFINEPLDFPPGEKWSYSNSGYIVLGLIIDEASGRPYRLFLRENFFEPLGMTATDLDDNTAIIENRAEGYQTYFRKADYIHMTIPYAAGALYSTVEDLFLWDQALFSGKVISQESFDAMLADTVPMEGLGIPEGLSYGYGLIINNGSQHPSIGHPGGINGFDSFMFHYPDSKLTIIMLSNIEGTLSGGIEAYLLGKLIEEE